MLPQDLRADIESHASVYESLLQLNESLFPTASKQCVKTIKEKFEELDKRWKALPQTVDKRLVLHSVFLHVNVTNIPMRKPNPKTFFYSITIRKTKVLDQYQSLDTQKWGVENPMHF